MLLGRELECAAIARLLGEARAGRSGALLVTGDPGIGKTALVEYAVEQADGMLVVRARGVQSEAAVTFGGLLEVARPLLAKVSELPERQAAALRVALTLERGRPPDRLTVGAATLSLLAAAAEDTPLLVAVDDAHWLDAESAEALGFAARRLQAERVAVVVAARTGEGREFEAAGLEAIRLGGLARGVRRAARRERTRRRGGRAGPRPHGRQPAGAARAAPLPGWGGRRGRPRPRGSGPCRRAARGGLRRPRRRAGRAHA